MIPFFLSMWTLFMPVMLVVQPILACVGRMRKTRCYPCLDGSYPTIPIITRKREDCALSVCEGIFSLRYFSNALHVRKMSLDKFCCFILWAVFCGCWYVGCKIIHASSLCEKLLKCIDVHVSRKPLFAGKLAAIVVILEDCPYPPARIFLGLWIFHRCHCAAVSSGQSLQKKNDF